MEADAHWCAMFSSVCQVSHACLAVQVQRQLKSIDAERTEAQDRVSDLTTQKTTIQAGKRKAEQQLSTLQEEYEEMETESRDNAEKLRKALEQVH